MQAEVLAENPSSNIRLLAVNDAGYESGVPPAIAGGETLPILQDTVDVGAWSLWSAQYRDLVVLDDGNGAVGNFNLTSLDLQVPANYARVKAYLRFVAGE
jgi:hypothetical protein